MERKIIEQIVEEYLDELEEGTVVLTKRPTRPPKPEQPKLLAKIKKAATTYVKARSTKFKRAPLAKSGSKY